MKTRDKFLTGILLVLIGVLLGMILTFFRDGAISIDLAEVRVTDINRSDQPFLTTEDLEKIDDRFLFRSVARSVTPTVVYIETVVTTRNRRARNEEGEEENRFWERFVPPRIQTVGSGVLISSDGYILTNNHVIEDAIRNGITVTLDDKRTFDARVVGGDPSTDLAVLKIDGDNLPAATIGNSDRLEVGEWVLAVGNPFRLRSTVTAGIISALSRDVQIIENARRIESFIQTDAAINRGNSGGALVNTSGEVIGINTAIATQNGNYQGYGFAVPSNLALKVSRDLIEFGEVKRGKLGVSIQSVNDRMARRAGLENISGVMVMSIERESAADKAGLRQNDIVLEVNGEMVNESNQLQEKVAMYRPNEEVSLTIWRNNEIIQKSVLLDEMEQPEPPRSTFDPDENELDEWDEIPEGGRERGVEQQRFESLGMTLRALATPEDPGQFNIYIHRVVPGSEAWNRGLKEGFEIIEIDGEPVSDLQVVEQKITNSIKNNRSLTLKILTSERATGYFQIN
ncbi:trypsin-like peptidase domain-containing protein [Rhodohalobacter halophilus]|uniref:trypsin-like peptidase domain-containing protein n=1 Tax=Rhodohalobacter halophilus TaxID=1812810 RepID=UPI00083F91D3|nr:trypsin-like peptidase domain-containing protein [Rhodohalobacter halophilus]